MTLLGGALVGWLVAGIVVVLLCILVPMSLLGCFLVGFFGGQLGLLAGAAVAGRTQRSLGEDG